MIHRPELLDALESAPAGPLATTAWRHMLGDRVPEQENIGGARWNPPGVAAIYLSLERQGAIAEGDYALAVQPINPRVRRFLYAVELTLENVVDLSDPAAFARTGLTGKDVASDDHAACQEVGAAIDWAEHDGLLVRSARSDCLNLVIYPAHRSADAIFVYAVGEELQR